MLEGLGYDRLTHITFSLKINVQCMYLALPGALWSFVTLAPSPPDRACCLSSDKSFSLFSFSGSRCFESCGTDLCGSGRLPEYVFFVTSTGFCSVPVSGFLDSED